MTDDRALLQRNDIAMTISKFDQFDFLIDIVPRDEIKAPPSRPAETGRTSSGGVLPDQVGGPDQVGCQIRWAGGVYREMCSTVIAAEAVSYSVTKE